MRGEKKRRLFWRKRENERIEELTEYLEKVNTGSGGVLFRPARMRFPNCRMKSTKR